MRHAVRLNRTCEALKFSQIVPIAHRFPRLRDIIKNVVTANKLSRYEHHRGISKPLQPGNGDLKVRPIAVVEGQQCAPARQTLRIQKPFEETTDIDQLPSILVQMAKLRGKNGFRDIKPASPTAGRRLANLMEPENRQPSTVELRVHPFLSHYEPSSVFLCVSEGAV